MRAYSGAVKTAIENAKEDGNLVEIIEYDELCETCSYSDFESLKHKISQLSGVILKVEYGSEVKINYKIPKSQV